MIAEEMKDLINDDEDEEEGAEGSGNESDIGKRKHEDSDLDDQVDEEDLDLIEENLGIKIKRKVSIYLVVHGVFFPQKITDPHYG